MRLTEPRIGADHVINDTTEDLAQMWQAMIVVAPSRGTPAILEQHPRR